LIALVVSVSEYPFLPPTRTTTDSIKQCLTGTPATALLPLRVAYVVPTFTLTPYSNFNSSFYAFYLKYQSSSGPVTTDLKWLQTHVTNTWSPAKYNNEKPLYDFLASATASNCGLALGKNLSLIDDPAVSEGGLFSGGVAKYDVVILGHEEYVTTNEFNQFQTFVAGGGRIVAICGNTFWGQVSYSPSTGIETFVAGHGFQFNGTAAWKSNLKPFDVESTSWFGSVFAGSGLAVKGAILTGTDSLSLSITRAFHDTSAFTDYSYPHNELNYVSNTSATRIIAKFYVDTSPTNASQVNWPPVPIEAYAHQYVRGQVVDMVIFGQDIILRDQEAQYFLISAVANPVTGTSATQSIFFLVVH
jgi:hypothetical protein